MRCLHPLSVLLVLLLLVTGCASLEGARGSRVDTVFLSSPLSSDSLRMGSHRLLQAHAFEVEAAADGIGLVATNEGDAAASVVLRMRWVLEDEPWGYSQSRLTASGTCRQRAAAGSDDEMASVWMPATWLGANVCFVKMLDLLEQLPHYRIWYEPGGSVPPPLSSPTASL